MGKLEVAEALLGIRYEKVCAMLRAEAEYDAADAAAQGENSLRIIIEMKKQALQQAVEEEVWDVKVIHTDDWRGSIISLRLAIKSTFDEAKMQYQYLLKDDPALREQFLKLAGISIPKCRNKNSSYMKQNYGKIERYLQRNGGSGDTRSNESDHGWGDILDQIQTVASLESLLELKEQLDGVLQETKRKATPPLKVPAAPLPEKSLSVGEQSPKADSLALSDAPTEQKPH